MPGLPATSAPLAGWSSFWGHKRGTMFGRRRDSVVACTKPQPRKWSMLAKHVKPCHEMAAHTGSRISKHWLCQIVAQAATTRLRMAGIVRGWHAVAIQFLFDDGGIALKPTTLGVHQTWPSSSLSACAIAPFVADTTLFCSHCDTYLPLLKFRAGKRGRKGRDCGTHINTGRTAWFGNEQCGG